MRRKTRTVHVGSVAIGGDAPVSIQSMTNRPARDFEGTIAQIQSLAASGCEIVRIAVPDTETAAVFSKAKQAGVTVPLVADIHFDYRIALEALRHGADKIRINPGNIGSRQRVRIVADACKSAGVPIRIGVNGGSLEKSLLEKYGSPTADALAESALRQAEMLEDMNFHNIVISIKSSRVDTMIHACRAVAAQSDYPLHLGVTEAGTQYSGIIKNAMGIGALLCDGIGDTIRVTLTADPAAEIEAAKEILAAAGVRKKGITVVSCPTCGRTKIDLISLAEAYKKAVANLDIGDKTITAAIMGCAVNGPGEAREADFGVAGGDGCAVLFRRGQQVCRIEEGELLDVLMKETYRMLEDINEK
ncbi:MAG: flavodoxin-dependent (E)-4-hydroxy-3-methylbut-2-enyl-diphosphate synthase [Clostridiales bacterium]|nr:flavodoxin-dependent (E)-4-hydroxy-3-methylbut-2-enyl-diphosphate synthase [Clostridiales bacterium]